MMQYIFYVIWMINIILVICRKKSRLITIVSVLNSQLVFYYCTSSADYALYYRQYKYKDIDIETGYNFLSNIGSNLGLTYNEFLFVMSGICFVIMLYVFSRFSNNYHIFFSIYYIYQFGIDVTQVRNFYATTILVLFFYFLYKGKRLGALILIILSISLHNTMWFYVPLLFINTNIIKKDKLLKYLALFIAMSCIFLKFSGGFFGNVSEILGNIIYNMGYVDKIGYFSTMSENGYLLYFGLYAINLLVINLGKYYLYNNIRDEMKKRQTERLWHFVLLINIYAILCFPLIIINMSFYRFYRNLYLLNIIFMCVCCDSFNKKSIDYYKYIAISMLCFLVYKLPLVHGAELLDNILEGIVNYKLLK